jgi:hypothetical protein
MNIIDIIIIIINDPIETTKIINFIFCSSLSCVVVVVELVNDTVWGRSNENQSLLFVFFFISYYFHTNSCCYGWCINTI